MALFPSMAFALADAPCNITSESLSRMEKMRVRVAKREHKNDTVTNRESKGVIFVL